MPVRVNEAAGEVINGQKEADKPFAERASGVPKTWMAVKQEMEVLNLAPQSRLMLNRIDPSLSIYI